MANVIDISRRDRSYTRINLLYPSIEGNLQLVDGPPWRVRKIESGYMYPRESVFLTGPVSGALGGVERRVHLK